MINILLISFPSLIFSLPTTEVVPQFVDQVRSVLDQPKTEGDPVLFEMIKVLSKTIMEMFLVRNWL